MEEAFERGQLCLLIFMRHPCCIGLRDRGAGCEMIMSRSDAESPHKEGN